MKRCPTCCQAYADESLKFCRDDGALLLSEAAAPDESASTLILSASHHSGALATDPLRGIPSIAVLPFVNMSADPDNEYFCDGLAEELINALTKVEQLRVVARTSAFSFKGKEVDVREIGQRLNVSTVLEGSVRKAGHRLRVTAQLINVADGYHLWSERYDRQLEDIFQLQDEISLAIVDALKVKLFGEEKAVVLKRHTDNVEAYHLYLKGRYFWNKRTPDGFRRGLEHFHQAIESDPSYALAFVGLADSYALLGFWGESPPREILPKAQAAAAQALEIDDQLAEAYASMGLIHFQYNWNWTGAEREFRRAIKLNQNYATAHHWLAFNLEAVERLDEAVAEIKLAQELDPLSLIINTNLGQALYFARRYDEAATELHRAIEMNPHFSRAHLSLGLVYEQKRMYEEAIAEFQKARHLDEIPWTLSGLGHAYAISGKRNEAEKIIAELKELSRRRFVSPFNIALIYAGLGETDQAFGWLERAYDERSVELTWLRVWPVLDGLRADGRFTELLRRVGLMS